jgi:antitoxin component of MazEF toxin-antitoxin module
MTRKRRTVRIGDIIHTEGKVIQVGGSKAVTLPKSWADEHNIELGDVLVKVANSVLTICVKSKEGAKP